MNHRGQRLCEYKVHHPRACRGYAFQTDRGPVIARIADKAESDQELNDTMKAVKMLSDAFLEGGEMTEVVRWAAQLSVAGAPRSVVYPFDV